MMGFPYGSISNEGAYAKAKLVASLLETHVVVFPNLWTMTAGVALLPGSDPTRDATKRLLSVALVSSIHKQLVPKQRPARTQTKTPASESASDLVKRAMSGIAKEKAQSVRSSEAPTQEKTR